MSELHVVVLGAGFAGLELCRKLAGERSVRVTLVDRENHHLFQPLLYQVATAGLAPSEIAEPIRSLFRRSPNVSVVMDEARRIDADARSVELASGRRLGYDRLVLATGAETFYFGNDEYAEHARGLKTLPDALRIRNEMLSAFERAEREEDPVRQAELMRIVIIGGGPTGVELAGALAELTRRVLLRDFRRIQPSHAEILLIEASPRVLGPFSEALSASAKRQLEGMGVDVRVGQRIDHVREGSVQLDGQTIRAATILWGAGVRAGPLGETFDAERDDRGRLVVEKDLTVRGHPEIHAIGDMAHVVDGAGRMVPGLAPAAIQMGRYVAERLRDVAAGAVGEPAPFVYVDRGQLATIGRSHAVAHLGRFEFSGLFAWLLWLFVHIAMLIGYRNRLLVLIQWFSAYFAYRQGARLIVRSEQAYEPTIGGQAHGDPDGAGGSG